MFGFGDEVELSSDRRGALEALLQEMRQQRGNEKAKTDPTDQKLTRLGNQARSQAWQRIRRPSH